MTTVPARGCTVALITTTLALGLASLPAHGQVLSGSLVVDVRDQSGAGIPGADVTITQTDTNWTRSGTTNETGTASFSTVPLGTFSVRVTLSGFKESVTTDVRVTQDDITRLRTALSIGELRAEVCDLTNTPHFDIPGGTNRNVSNLQLNADGTVRNLGGFSSITSTANSGRDGIDERVLRIGLRFGF